MMSKIFRFRHGNGQKSKTNLPTRLKKQSDFSRYDLRVAASRSHTASLPHTIYTHMRTGSMSDTAAEGGEKEGPSRSSSDGNLDG